MKPQHMTTAEAAHSVWLDVVLTMLLLEVHRITHLQNEKNTNEYNFFTKL
jgi:hypothetical protein